jgi:LysR family transcriptional regulator (chromosome initiation inhibitor)
MRLGALRYAATASPEFARRYFAEGVSADTLARAPVLRFDRRDKLQGRWAREATGLEQLTAHTHWVPSTQGFVDMVARGLGWAMNPIALVSGHIESGRLVELGTIRLDVVLYWQHVRLGQVLLNLLTREVTAAARRHLEAVDPSVR